MLLQGGMHQGAARRWHAGSHAGGWSWEPGTGWPELPPAGNTSLNIILTSSELAKLSTELASVAVRPHDMAAAAIHTSMACRCEVTILRGDLDGLCTLSCNEQCHREVRSMPARPVAQHERQIAACLAKAHDEGGSHLVL